MSDHFPSIDNLNVRLRRKLVGQEILAVEIVGEPWRDDHEFCCDLRLTTGSGTVKCSVWWVGWEFLAAVTYAKDVPTALREVNEIIDSRINQE